MPQAELALLQGGDDASGAIVAPPESGQGFHPENPATGMVTHVVYKYGLLE